MDPATIPWYTLRRGDVIVVEGNRAVRVAAVAFNGAVWDIYGDAWMSQDPNGNVTRLRPATPLARDMFAMAVYDESTRCINVEVRCGWWREDGGRTCTTSRTSTR